MALYRIAYTSTSLIGGDPATERFEIAELLLHSRRHNKSLEVSGALLATSSKFAQVLEGERANVEHVFPHQTRSAT